MIIVDEFKNNNSIKQKVIKDNSQKLFIKNEQLHFKKVNQLNEICKPPLKNEQYRIITEKQFNAYALILSILEQNIINEMYLAIYRINEPTVLSIINFIESGKIKKATFVISNFFNQTKKPEKWAKILREYSEQKTNVNHIYVHNHSKILAVETDNKNYYVFEVLEICPITQELNNMYMITIN